MRTKNFGKYQTKIFIGIFLLILSITLLTPDTENNPFI